MGVGVAAGLAGCPGDSGTGGGDGTDTPAGTPLPEVELRNSDGSQASLTLYYQANDSQQQQTGEQISSDLARLGINVELESQPRDQLLGQYLNSQPLEDANPDEFEYGPIGRNAGPPDQTRVVGEWDMLIGIVANSYPRTPDNTNSFFVRDGSVNVGGYVSDTDLNSLYEEFSTATSEQARTEAITEVFSVLSEELPANFLSQSKDYWGFRQDINTSEAFNEYGFSNGTANRYRGSQEVNGDFVWLSNTPSTNFFVPELDDTNSDRRLSLTADYSWAITPDNEIFPLFMDIEDTGDGQVYVCTIRDGIQFGTGADGEDFGQMTAEDWVWQTRNVHGVADNAADMWNEETPPSTAIGDYAVIDSIEQTGELEFQVELGSADPLFPLRPVLWAARTLPKDLYTKYTAGDQYDAQALRQSPEIQNLTWTGNLGPYDFENREAGNSGSFTATRADDYYLRNHVESSNVGTVDSAYADAPYFENYQFNNVAEQSVSLEQFRNGQGDRYALPSSAIQEFQQAVEDVRVEAQFQPFISFLFFNMRSNGSPILKEVEGRQAVASVINKNVISEQINRGFTSPTSTFQPTWSAYYSDEGISEYGIDITREDVANAREMVSGIDGFTLEEA